MSENEQIKIIPLERDININAGRIAENYRQVNKEVKFQNFLEDLLTPNSLPAMVLSPIFFLNTFSLYCTLFTWQDDHLAIIGLLIFLSLFVGISAHICWRTKFKFLPHLIYYWLPTCSGIFLGFNYTAVWGGQG